MVRLYIFVIILGFFICPDFLLAENSASQKSQYVHYQVKPGDTLSNIFRRLHLEPIWGPESYIEKTIKLNRKNKTWNQQTNHLATQQVIQLPIVVGDPKYRYYRYQNKNFLLLSKPSVIAKKITPKTQKKAVKKTIKRKLASPKRISSDKIENFSFQYSCPSERTYKDISQFLANNKQHMKNMKVSFRCGGKHKDVRKESFLRSASSVSHEDVLEPIKLKPWMMSYAQSVTYEGDDPTESSFFFPSVGYNSISYTEGDSIDTHFGNLFISFRYRNILVRPSWHVDFEIKYGLLDLANEIENSQAQLLDIDLRLGRSLPLFSEPWRLTLFAGAFYSQMFVKDQLYGYKGVYYPQLYPELRRLFRSGSSLSVYLKYMPTGQQFLSASSGEQAFTFGAQYNFEFQGANLFLNVNHGNLKFTSGTGNTPVEVIQQNIAVGGGF